MTNSVLNNTDTITNPYYSGCLQAKIPRWTVPRVCSSQDPQWAASQGLCRRPEFDYMEIRVGTGNWESSTAVGWVTQIILSEILGVPTTVEAGGWKYSRDFYDPTSRLDNEESVRPDDVARAARVPDCRALVDSERGYQPCAHFLPETWGYWQELVLDQKIEPPHGLGVLGYENWFVTKFTAEKYPQVVSHHGLTGEENRKLLADIFWRPTNWSDYCLQVSTDNCTSPDKVAQRPPVNKREGGSFFSEGNYTGYFRYTEKNNCTLTENCTGHIANYPCGWGSNMESYIYHENIALDPNNGENGGPNGYSYEQLIQLWHAANATDSHLMMFWWSPEPLYQRFVGTKAEFQRVLLKPYTLECANARLISKDECSDNRTMRVGSPEESCDNPAEPLRKSINVGLRETLYSPKIPRAAISPAYDVMRLFSISDLEMGELFDLIASERTMRDAVCTWAVDHLGLLNATIPSKYPRTVQEEEHSILGYATLSVGAIGVIIVLYTSWAVYTHTNKPAIQFAQVDFLAMLLVGSFLVCIGSMLQSLPAGNATCVATIWFINLGYTIELVPLILKVGAVNKIMQASQNLRRVSVRKEVLYRVVGVICIPVTAGLAVWSAMDPPSRGTEYSLTNTLRQRGPIIWGDGDYVVSKTYYCHDGDSNAWQYGYLAWNAILLVCASVLAFQSRNIVVHFNESRTLAFLIYSHFVFVVLRICTFLFSDQVDGSVLDHLRSVLYATDQMAACLIYFLPKLLPNEDSLPPTISQWSSFAPDGARHPSSGSGHVTAPVQHAHAEEVDSSKSNEEAEQCTDNNVTTDHLASTNET